MRHFFFYPMPFPGISSQAISRKVFSVATPISPKKNSFQIIRVDERPKKSKLDCDHFENEVTIKIK
jgi:hypothetical protein